MDRLHRSIQTAAAVTIIMSLACAVMGALSVEFLLRFMSTPEDVMPDAMLYLRIYFIGIPGLLIYNMGSGILRAVGDTVRPLYFLILTSVLNILLDLLFVLGFGMGVMGVALATILAQLVSALLTLRLLTRTDDIYKLTFHDMRIDGQILGRIFSVGLPAGIQSVITAFSNIFVQSYVNFFGSACMAGWSCYNKLDQYIMLPMQSMALASTTFVSQNIGARQYDRADRGTFVTIGMTLAVTAFIGSMLFIFVEPAVSLFSEDPEVISFGALFLRWNVFFLLFNCVNHVLAGGLRGRGDSTGPMVIMLACFVGLRQIYLFVVTHFVANTPILVGLGYPVGWFLCCVTQVSYFLIRRKHYHYAGIRQR